MVATIVTTRNALATAITAGSYVYTTIATSQIYLPETDGTNLSSTVPKVELLSLALSNTRLTRNLLSSYEIATQILITKKVTPSNTSDMDDMVEFMEQVANEIREKVIGSGIEWLRNEASSTGEDEEYPYFVGLLGNTHIFQGSFVAFHKVSK